MSYYKKCSKKDCRNPLRDNKGLLPVTEFSPDKRATDGLYSICKDCRRRYYFKPGVHEHHLATMAEYREQPEVKIKLAAYGKVYRTTPEYKASQKKHKHTPEFREWENNYSRKRYAEREDVRLQRSQYDKSYRAKPENKVKINKRDKERRDQDIQYRLKGNLRARLRTALYNQLAGKQVSAVADLGMSLAEFKIYIES